MIIPALFAIALALGQSGHAPPDVPRNHWAFKAVDELFMAGLLDGYPAGSKALKRETAAHDRTWLENVIGEWKRQGLLVGYSSEPLTGGRPESNYEQAVALHAMWFVVVRKLADSSASPAVKVKLFMSVSDLSNGISMRSLELRALGVSPEQMVLDLDNARARYKGLARFHG